MCPVFSFPFALLRSLRRNGLVLSVTAVMVVDDENASVEVDESEDEESEVSSFQVRSKKAGMV